MITQIFGIILSVLLFFPCCGKSASQQKTEPEVIQTSVLTDGWYNHDAAQLNKELDYYFELAAKHFTVPVEQNSVKALIVPHAGFFYSGLCAATAYQTLFSSGATREGVGGNGPHQYPNSTITRVIILCPSHSTFFNGVVLPDYTTYKTPLGEIPVDTQAIALLKKFHVFKRQQGVHDKEHAIEIQLPFLQKTVADFSIIPLVVGYMPPEEILYAADALQKIVTPTTLVVISSDFVHHGKNYDYALFDKNIVDHVKLIDSYATQAIVSQSLQNFDDVMQKTGATICGHDAIRILLALLQKNVFGPLESKLGSYYTSAHMALARGKELNIDINKLFASVDDKDATSSVSYVGMVFLGRPFPPATSLKADKNILTGYEKRALLTTVRATIANEFVPESQKKPERLMAPLLSFGMQIPAGAFVTLNTKKGDLRGCIGRIVTNDILAKTVADMSLSSAFHDDRFSPLTKEELDNIVIDISVLTPPVPVNSYKDIIIGKHGIILNKLNEQGRIIASSVFLPQVARDWHWTIEQTLEQLSRKAGLAGDAWQNNCSFQVFEGFEIKE